MKNRGKLVQMFSFKFLSLFMTIAIAGFPLLASAIEETEQSSKIIKERQMPPPYLYKVLSVEDWKESENRSSVKLSPADKKFIHLSTAEQLDKIIAKFWSGNKEFIVLKLNTSRLPGELRYEANPGGTNKYYHLYQGSIPLDAVEESKRMHS